MKHIVTLVLIFWIAACAKKEAAVVEEAPSVASSARATNSLSAGCDEILIPGSATREIDLEKDSKTYCIGELHLNHKVFYKDVASALPSGSVPEVTTGATTYRSATGVDFVFGGPVLILSRILIHPAKSL